jgi:hypothetical protein
VNCLLAGIDRLAVIGAGFSDSLDMSGIAPT